LGKRKRRIKTGEKMKYIIIEQDGIEKIIDITFNGNNDWKTMSKSDCIDKSYPEFVIKVGKKKLSRKKRKEKRLCK
jgi:hypothetical protein